MTRPSKWVLHAASEYSISQQMEDELQLLRVLCPHRCPHRCTGAPICLQWFPMVVRTVCHYQKWDPLNSMSDTRSCTGESNCMAKSQSSHMHAQGRKKHTKPVLYFAVSFIAVPTSKAAAPVKNQLALLRARTAAAELQQCPCVYIVS